VKALSQRDLLDDFYQRKKRGYLVSLEIFFPSHLGDYLESKVAASKLFAVDGVIQ
jgi:hypothetical protein